MLPVMGRSHPAPLPVPLSLCIHLTPILYRVPRAGKGPGLLGRSTQLGPLQLGPLSPSLCLGTVPVAGLMLAFLSLALCPCSGWFISWCSSPCWPQPSLSSCGFSKEKQSPVPAWGQLGAGCPVEPGLWSTPARDWVGVVVSSTPWLRAALFRLLLNRYVPNCHITLGACSGGSQGIGWALWGCPSPLGQDISQCLALQWALVLGTSCPYL